MDPTITALIVAATSLVGNLALLVKVITDKIKLTNERAATAAARDKDSQALHDATQKNTWDIGILRDEMNLLKTQQQDTEHEISIVVKELAVVSTKLDNLIELVKQEHV